MIITIENFLITIARILILELQSYQRLLSSFNNYTEILPNFVSMMVLKFSHPPRLNEASLKSQTPVVIQRNHAWSNKLVSISSTANIEHNPWLICFFLCNPTGHRMFRVRVARLVLLIETFSISWWCWRVQGAIIFDSHWRCSWNSLAENSALSVTYMAVNVTS